MDIRYSRSLNNLIVYFSGELDECSSGIVKIQLDRLFGENLNANKIIFDLSGLSFMDSTGIGLLIGRYKKLNKSNIPSYIRGANCQIEKVLELSGLYSIMPKV